MGPVHGIDRRQFVGTLVASAAGGLPALALPTRAMGAQGRLPPSNVTLPITAASFPPSVLPVGGGRIEFWARLLHVEGAISGGGYDPHFFQLVDPTTNFHTTYHLGFNSNDGAGNGGLVGVVGQSFLGGSGLSSDWTYEDIFGAGETIRWHYYSFQWNEAWPGVRKFSIYVDGALNTTRWHALADQTFPPVSQGTFNLISTAGPARPFRHAVQMHCLRIWDANDTLILHNELETQADLENSLIGPNGTFNGFGHAQFVPNAHDAHGALQAFPVRGIGTA